MWYQCKQCHKLYFILIGRCTKCGKLSSLSPEPVEPHACFGKWNVTINTAFELIICKIKRISIRDLFQCFRYTTWNQFYHQCSLVNAAKHYFYTHWWFSHTNMNFANTLIHPIVELVLRIFFMRFNRFRKFNLAQSYTKHTDASDIFDCCSTRGAVWARKRHRLKPSEQYT